MAGKLVLAGRKGLYWFQDGNDTTNYANGTKIINADDGTINTTVETLVDLTTTGNTVLGNNTADSTTITGTVSSTSASTTGASVSATNTGVYTGVGAFQWIANALTTGVAVLVSATGVTTGIIHKVVATAATLTTGRYYSANDGATEVFGIGANGHIHSTVSTAAPSCAITTAQGITAATITAGSTDTCGVITTTGTQNNTADSTFTITFGKTYTTAPKSVTLTPANGAGAVGSSLPYVSSISATAVVIGVTKSASAAATPSWYYQIIA